MEIFSHTASSISSLFSFVESLRCIIRLCLSDSSCAGTKTISDRTSVHKGNADFGAVFTTERCCAALILKVNRHVSDRFSYHSLASCEQVPDCSGSQ